MSFELYQTIKPTRVKLNFMSMTLIRYLLVDPFKMGNNSLKYLYFNFKIGTIITDIYANKFYSLSSIK